MTKRGIVTGLLLVAVILAFPVAYYLGRSWGNAAAMDELADLRHAGLKLYYEAWEACFDKGKPWPAEVAGSMTAQAKGRADQWRRTVHAFLEQHYGKAVAIEFNTPRMHEPSPPNRSLAACPVNVEIVQHGYRLDRLGDILLRERSRR